MTVHRGNGMLMMRLTKEEYPLTVVDALAYSNVSDNYKGDAQMRQCDKPGKADGED